MKFWIGLALLNLALLFVFGRYLAPEKHFKQAPDDVTQRSMDLYKNLDMLNYRGHIMTHGWQINAEKFIVDNSKNVLSVPNKLFRSFQVLAMFIDTPKHHIFVTTPVVMFGSVCVSKVVILEKENPAKTIKASEFKPFCPAVWERDSLFYFDGKGVENDQGSLRVKLGQHGDDQYRFSVQSDDLRLSIEAKFAKRHDSMMWMTPLSDDLSRFFATVKKSGIPLESFSYTY